MDADGGNARAITDSFVDEYSPAWSPDGQWIVYTAGTGQDGHGTFDLWLIRPDGSDQRLVTAAANTQMSPQFRPGDSFLLGR
jgi:TolB protein